MTEKRMKKPNNSWRINRQINVSVFIQLFLLASLIVGSWVNLQSQLTLLQRDVATLLAGQSKFEKEIETLRSSSVSYEYRLRSIEKEIENKGER